MKPILPIILLFLMSLGLCAQTTIHIDPDYSGGSSDGSLEHPYTSWQEAMPVTSGNTYLQKRGTLCEVDYHIPLAPDVTVGAYGEGERPIVENIASIDGYYGLFHIFNREGQVPNYLEEYRTIVIRDMEIRANDMLTNILFEGNVEDYLVEDCVMRGGQWGMRILTWGNADEDLKTKQNERFGRVMNNSITGCGDDGIFIGWTFIGIEIGYNVIDDINRKYFGEFGGSSQSQYTAPGDPIQVNDGAPKLWIHHNYLDKSDTQYKFALILQSHKNDDPLIPVIVEHNILIGQGRDTAAGVYLDGTFDIVFRGNVITNSSTAIFQKSASKSQVQVYNNVFHNNNGVMSNEANVGAEFHNNTIIGSNAVLQSSFGKRLSMMNNLLYSPDGTGQNHYLIKNAQNVAPAADKLVMDYNLVWPGHAGMWIHLGDSYDTLAQWQATGFGANSLVQDPLFVDPSIGDYRLADGSPAKGTGVIVPDITPEDVTTPDIGANMDEFFATGVGPDGSIPLLTTLMPETYGPFPVDGSGSFDTGDWMGWFSVTSIEGYVWSYTTGSYWYLTEDALNASKQGGGVWAFFLR